MIGGLSVGAGCATTPKEDEPAKDRIDWGAAPPAAVSKVEFVLAWPDDADGRRLLDGTSPPLFGDADPLLTGSDVVAAEAMHSENDSLVAVTFSGVGSQRLADATLAYRAPYLAVLIDQKAVVSPRILAPVLDGTFLIRADYSKHAAERLAARIRGDDPDANQGPWWWPFGKRAERSE